jgi:hypothetical protein
MPACFFPWKNKICVGRFPVNLWKSLRSVLFVLSSLFFISQVTAQTFTGTFVGTVTDASGAGVAGATVTITNIETSAQRMVNTDASGGFVVTLLPPGNYKIVAEMKGFKKAVHESVLLEVNQQQRVDSTLAVGEVSEQVIVNEGVPLVQTESATVGTVVEQREVTELPLNGRNFLQLNLLVPGTLPGAKGSQLGTQGGSINVHGLREASNFFWLDGIDNTTQAIGQLVVNPPTYTVQEFKVQSPTYAAEFGRTAGAQINIITRSGSNTLHGDVYEYLRNSVLDAKNFFDQASSKIPIFQRNQFGVDAGGKIIRDKLFFFGGYEGIRENRAGTFKSVVPTSAMVGGDLGAICPEGFTAAGLCNNAAHQLKDPAAPGAVFAFNKIPSNRLDTAGAGLALAGYPAGTTLDRTFNPVNTLSDNSFVWKIDYALSSKDHLFGRYNYQNIQEVQPVNIFASTTNIPGFGRHQDNTRFQTLGFNDTHSFSPTLVGEFRFGWNRWKLAYFQQDQGNDIATKLGIVGLSTNPVDTGFPLIQLPGFYDALGSATNLPQEGPFDTYQFGGTFSKVVRNHNLKFGADYHYFASTFFLDFAARGRFIFFGGFTGDPLGDLLLGLPGFSLRGVGKTDFLFVSKSLSEFFEDSWRVKPNLTLTLGMRYEYNVPIVEKKNRVTNFDFTTGLPVQAGQAGVSRSTYNPDKNNFAPRIGFSWDPFKNGKWSLRGGYGVFYDIVVINTMLGLRLNPPFFEVDALANDPAKPILLEQTFANPQALRLDLSAFEKNFRDGLVQQWSFGIQHELVHNLLLDVGYVGTKGTDLYRTFDPNQAVLGAGTVASRRPFPAFGPITTVGSNAKSIYHGLEARLEKRFSNGLSFLSSYTYSKSIDDSSAEFNNNSDSNFPQNSHNLSGERSLSNFDARHRWVLSYIYELPFGPKRKYLGDATGVAGKLLEGWQLNGIWQFQSGQPYTPGIASDNSNTGELADRPDRVGDPNAPGGTNCPQTHTPKCWVNPAAFGLAAPGTFGDAGRGSLIGPGLKEIDFSLFKNTAITEGRIVQFRAEFFNIANHPNFENPLRTWTPGTTTTFGQIQAAGPSRQIQFGLRFIF